LKLIYPTDDPGHKMEIPGKNPLCMSHTVRGLVILCAHFSAAIPGLAQPTSQPWDVPPLVAAGEGENFLPPVRSGPAGLPPDATLDVTVEIADPSIVQLSHLDSVTAPTISSGGAVANYRWTSASASIFTTFRPLRCGETTYTLTGVDAATGARYVGSGRILVGGATISKDVVQLVPGESTKIDVRILAPNYQPVVQCDEEDIVSITMSADETQIELTGLKPGEDECSLSDVLINMARTEPLPEGVILYSPKTIDVRVAEIPPVACTAEFAFDAEVVSVGGDAALLAAVGVQPGQSVSCDAEFIPDREFNRMICNNEALGDTGLNSQSGCVSQWFGPTGEGFQQVLYNIVFSGDDVRVEAEFNDIRPNRPMATAVYQGSRRLTQGEITERSEVRVEDTDVSHLASLIRMFVFAPDGTPVTAEVDKTWLAVHDSQLIVARALGEEGSERSQASPNLLFEGSGAVQVVFEANPNPEPRSAVVTLAGHAINVTQDGTASRRPRIAADGVVDGAAFFPVIAPNGWSSMLGEFFLEGTRVWGGDDFVEGQLPTELDGVRIEVDGVSAAVQFLSNNQINFLPLNAQADGLVDIRVTTPSGESVVSRVFLSEVLPEFFRFSPQGLRYVAAVHPDGVFVGPSDLFGGAVATRPARPGDVIQVFGTGWGATDPPTDPANLVAAPVPLADEATIEIGGLPARVLFGGIIGSGLYQFNVETPELDPGDHLVFGSALNKTNSRAVYLTVGP